MIKIYLNYNRESIGVINLINFLRELDFVKIIEKSQAKTFDEMDRMVKNSDIIINYRNFPMIDRISNGKFQISFGKEDNTCDLRTFSQLKRFLTILNNNSENGVLLDEAVKKYNFNRALKV